MSPVEDCRTYQTSIIIAFLKKLDSLLKSSNRDKKSLYDETMALLEEEFKSIIFPLIIPHPTSIFQYLLITLQSFNDEAILYFINPKIPPMPRYADLLDLRLAIDTSHEFLSSLKDYLEEKEMRGEYQIKQNRLLQEEGNRDYKKLINNIQNYNKKKLNHNSLVIKKYSLPKPLKKNDVAQWVKNTSVKSPNYGLQIPSISRQYKEICLSCTPSTSTDPIHHIQCDNCTLKLRMDVHKNNKNKPIEIDESPKKDILISQGLSKDLYILSSKEKGKKNSSPVDLNTPNNNNADR